MKLLLLITLMAIAVSGCKDPFGVKKETNRLLKAYNGFRIIGIDVCNYCDFKYIIVLENKIEKHTISRNYNWTDGYNLGDTIKSNPK